MKKVINYFVFFTIGTMFFIHSSNSAVFYPKDENPMFSNHENQISGYFGMGSKTWYFETSLFSTFLRYSQPDKFLRLPGRLSFETGGMFGFKDKNRNIDYSQYNQAFFGFTQDVLIFYTKNTYIGVGLGGYIKTRDEFENDVTRPRVNSIFVFGVSAYLGQKITNDVNLELFYKHFSNGKLQLKNIGHNFIGLSINYNFL